MSGSGLIVMQFDVDAIRPDYRQPGLGNSAEEVLAACVTLA
jgi:hypothetical protein